MKKILATSALILACLPSFGPVTAGFNLAFNSTTLAAPSHTSGFMTALCTNYVELDVLRTANGSAQLAGAIFLNSGDVAMTAGLFLFSAAPSWTGTPGQTVRIPSGDSSKRCGFVIFDSGAVDDFGSTRNNEQQNLRVQVRATDSTTKVYAIPVALGSYSVGANAITLKTAWLRD